VDTSSHSSWLHTDSTDAHIPRDFGAQAAEEKEWRCVLDERSTLKDLYLDREIIDKYREGREAAIGKLEEDGATDDEIVAAVAESEAVEVVAGEVESEINAIKAAESPQHQELINAVFGRYPLTTDLTDRELTAALLHVKNPPSSFVHVMTGYRDVLRGQVSDANDSQDVATRLKTRLIGDHEAVSTWRDVHTRALARSVLHRLCSGFASADTPEFLSATTEGTEKRCLSMLAFDPLTSTGRDKTGKRIDASPEGGDNVSMRGQGKEG
jgi:hypothetical protein